MSKLLVTHSGAAHLDDFLSASVAFAAGLADVVERREPTDDELADPSVVVVDIGGFDDPSKGNHDHHQLPREAEAMCALTSLVRELEWDGLSVLEAFRATKWFRSLEVMDSKGPSVLASELGTTKDVVLRLLSPVERVLVDQFGSMERVELATEFGRLMEMVGRGILDESVSSLKRVKALDNEARIVEVGGVPGFVLESKDPTGTSTWRELRAPGTAFSIMEDDRGPGWKLFRFDDDPRINFSRLKGREEVIFVHNVGFIAKTADRAEITLEKALELVRDSVVE